MPRRISRFARLNRLLKATNGSIPATGEIHEYHKFTTGLNKVDIDNKVPPGYMKMFGVGVIPFGQYPSTGSGSYIRVGITQQADVLRNKLGTKFSDSDLGIERTATNIENNTGSFYPALLKVAITPTAQNVGPKTSGITKESYNRIKSRSGSIPFGRSVTAVVDAETLTAITDLAKVYERDMLVTLRNKMSDSLNADKTIKADTTFKLVSYSFESELFRANHQDRYGSAPTTPPTFPAIV